jgi:hypothetical protein
MKLTVMFAVLVIQLHAEMPSKIPVKTAYGAMEFYGISLNNWQTCGFKASLSNTTGVAWTDLEFQISIDGVDGSGQKTSASANAHVQRVSGDGVSLATGSCNVPQRFNPVKARAALAGVYKI